MVPGMIWVNPGIFSMGSPTTEEGRSTLETEHQVTITKGFYMGETTVTQEQYVDIMGYNPSSWPYEEYFGEMWKEFPMDSMSWYDAVEYCNFRSVKEGLTPVYTFPRYPATGYPITGISGSTIYFPTIDWTADGYRLPTEAEWEYACRAGTTTPYNFINLDFTKPIYDDDDEVIGYEPTTNPPTYGTSSINGWMANYDDYDGYPLPEWIYDPNSWGLYSMHGNMREWCSDNFTNTNYGTAAATDPRGPSAASISGAFYNVQRGGSYWQAAAVARSANRSYQQPYAVYQGAPANSTGADYVGFRVIRNAANPPSTQNERKISGQNSTARTQELRSALREKISLQKGKILPRSMPQGKRIRENSPLRPVRVQNFIKVEGPVAPQNPNREAPRSNSETSVRPEAVSSTPASHVRPEGRLRRKSTLE
jgi:formylglycine-generating enzyme required for sulfatase activity